MEGLIAKLAEQGIAYLLLAISISANYLFIKLLLSEKDKRIIEAEKVRDTISKPLDSIQSTLEGVQTLLQVLSKKT